MIKLSSLLWSAIALIMGSWISGFVFGFWEIPLTVTIFYVVLIVVVLISDKF